MNTPFGDITVADAHVHFFSYRFFATLASSLPERPSESELVSALRERLPFDIPAEDPVELGRRWVAELDRYGLARTVLIASVPGDEDSVAAAVRAFPNRFIPYFMLDPRPPDALERTERAFRELGMKGLCLFPAMHHFRVSETRLRPILEEVASRRGIVFAHCGELTVGVRDKLGLASPFDPSFASPRELRDVASRFDSLPFVIPHFGGTCFHELLDVASECPNVYVDTSSSNAWMERLPEPLALTQVLARALEILGAERILYGSDSSFFPRGWHGEHFRAQAAALAELAMTPERAALVFGGNLERLLRASDVD